MILRRAALAAALALLFAAPARAEEEEPPIVLDGGGGITIRLLGSGGTSWTLDEGGTSGAASPFAAGGAIALDLWNHDRSAAGRFSIEAGAYGVALEAAAIVPIGDRADALRPYGILGVTLAALQGGAGVGAVIGAGLQLDVSGPLALCVEARFHGVGHEEDSSEASVGAAGLSVLAGVAFTF